MNLLRRHLLPALLALALAAPSARALTVGAAANLTFVLTPLSDAFRQKHPGVKVEVVMGSSGNLFAQIKHGAPYDLFLSADTLYPKRLGEEGMARKESFTVFARGRLAFWSTRIPFEQLTLEQLLRDPRIRRVAIANPKTAPYGEAARSVLQRLGLWESAQPERVTGENIAQTAQFVESGNADAGFVALSLLRSPKLSQKGDYRVVPEAWHEPLDHAAVITRRGADNPDARAFLDFLRTPEARKVLEAYGYSAPE